MESVQERMKRLGTYEKIASFMQKEQQDYAFKHRYAMTRAKEFKSECDKRGLNCHVSVGGLDSIVLYLFLNEVCGIDVPGVSASTLEDASIQRVHKAIGIINVPPLKRADGTRWTKPKVIAEFGFPVISKEIAGKIELLQNPTDKNKTVRHAIITGETGEYGGWQKNSKMQLNQKWLKLFGGYENENEGCDYKTPDFKVSSKCCYYLKEKNCDDWGKEHNSVPYLGLMASEGGRRAKSLRMNGCNYFGASTIRSAPFAIFHRQDILTLALEMDERKNVSEPKKISVSNGKEYCGHCGYLCEYARGYKKFYCIRCGGLNLRSWKNLEVKKMKKEVDGVVVEAKSILTALKIIKTVCEGNKCQTCPFGKIDDTTRKTLCMIKCIAPNVWIINDETDVWRALR